MESLSYFIGDFFNSLIGLLSPISKILIGLLLTRIPDVLYTLNLLPENEVLDARKQKTIKLVKYIGMIMIIYGGLLMIRQIIRFFTNILGLLGSMF